MNVKCLSPLIVTLATSLAGVLIPSAVAARSVSSASGFVSGPIVKVNASGFQVTTSITQTGTSTVKLAASTEVSEQIEATEKSVKKGICVAAFGTADAKGKVTATTLTISRPSKGSAAERSAVAEMAHQGRQGRRPSRRQAPARPRPDQGSAGTSVWQSAR